MNEESRRDFMHTVLGMGTAVIGLALVEPVAANIAQPVTEQEMPFVPRWIDKIYGHQHWHVWKFGFGETHVWATDCYYSRPQDVTSWYIRCESTFRPGELFKGTEGEAKKMAELFTRDTLQANLVAVEKVAFALRK